MHCTACDTESEPADRFCQACGTALATTPSRYVISNAPVSGSTCPTCRQRNPTGASYCVFCATQLIAGAPATTSTVQGAYTGQTAAASSAVQPIEVKFAGPGNLIIRAAWFFLIGWWLGLIWTIVAWLFNLTLIGLPVGLLMLNAIPRVMTLKPRTPRIRAVQVAPAGTVVSIRQPEQPLALRALWFLLVGSWASLLWMLAAWWCCATVILMPIAFWMFDRVPTISTLAAE